MSSAAVFQFFSVQLKSLNVKLNFISGQVLQLRFEIGEYQMVFTSSEDIKAKY